MTLHLENQCFHSARELPLRADDIRGTDCARQCRGWRDLGRSLGSALGVMGLVALVASCGQALDREESGEAPNAESPLDGAQPLCSGPTACGGALVGTWVIEACCGCEQRSGSNGADAEADATASCELQETSRYELADGVLAIFADGSYTHEHRWEVSEETFSPAECLEPGAVCQPPRTDGAGWRCDDTAGCLCSRQEPPVTEHAWGSWRVTGSTLRLTDAQRAFDPPRLFEYCASGDTLRLREYGSETYLELTRR